MPGTLVLGAVLAGRDLDLGRYLWIAAAVAILSVFWPRTELIIRDGALHGPRPWALGRVSIPLDELDIERSRGQGRFGPRLIWSTRGRAIWIDSVGIPAAQRNRVLDTLGLK